MTFDQFTNAQALTEGWDIFDCDGEMQIQRLDDPWEARDLDDDATPICLDDDSDAWRIVLQQASYGSAYHLAALAAVSDAERKRIADFVAKVETAH